MRGKSEEEIIEEVERFLTINFPQIAMHGGSADVESFDSESGKVVIRLGDACSGCGISPMTMNAINNRLIEDIPEISIVDVGEKNETSPTVGPFTDSA